MAFTQRQIMLSLAYAAYTDELLVTGSPSLDAQIKADLELNLSMDAKFPIPPVAGQWSVVWGPVSYTVPGSLYQDNMMYVARLNQPATHPPLPPQYAIAVRGTNCAALLNWLMDDLDILQTMPWPPGVSSSRRQISESTSIGLQVLLAMEDGGTGQTLLQFLADKIQHAPTLPVSLCCTGHSLGAALASTLALYLRHTQASWDPASKAIVTTINFAGPSAGNAHFAGHFDQVFTYTGTSPLPFWSPPTTSPTTYADCVRTSLDIVPLLWNTANMKTISDIYSPFTDAPLPPFPLVYFLSHIPQPLQDNDYTQIQANQPTVQGTFVEPDNLPPSLQGVEQTSAWLAETAFQHHNSYPEAFHVRELRRAFPLRSGVLNGVNADAEPVAIG